LGLEKLVYNVVIIGLGYVGLPLAVAMAKKHNVIGYDVDSDRVQSIRRHEDFTGEVSRDNLKLLERFKVTDSTEQIVGADFYIITVPTPVDENNIPDLRPLESASSIVGRVIRPGSVVIYESTVFPGATEEVCVPILVKESSLTFNLDFFVGYSPERINPGDKLRKLEDIKKIVSASTPEALCRVESLYKSIIKAGICSVSSIKVAEAAKVVENAQRDLNISFMNEISKIFYRANINTKEVINAASTKWNFIPFYPGLVGGHCIGVDPYYLTTKAESLGYFPDLLLTVRRVNESMPAFILNVFIEKYLNRENLSANKDILIFGVSFKENCPDIRNSKVIDLVDGFKKYGFNVEIVDPVVKVDSIGPLKINRIPTKDRYAGVILAVPHHEFVKKQQTYFSSLLVKNGIFFDLKSVFEKDLSDFQL
jgi:UDP-N-acetyl-D-galactosamine dehydrogenase